MIDVFLYRVYETSILEFLLGMPGSYSQSGSLDTELYWPNCTIPVSPKAR
jgi:hypothetical protein